MSSFTLCNIYFLTTIPTASVYITKLLPPPFIVLRDFSTNSHSKMFILHRRNMKTDFQFLNTWANQDLHLGFGTSSVFNIYTVVDSTLWISALFGSPNSLDIGTNHRTCWLARLAAFIRSSLPVAWLRGIYVLHSIQMDGGTTWPFTEFLSVMSCPGLKHQRA